MGEAMRALGRAIHTLQAAWATTAIDNLNHLPHYYDENFDPGQGRVADEQTLKALALISG